MTDRRLFRRPTPPRPEVRGPDGRTHHWGPHACIENGLCPYYELLDSWIRGRSVGEFFDEYEDVIAAIAGHVSAADRDAPLQRFLYLVDHEDRDRDERGELQQRLLRVLGVPTFLEPTRDEIARG